MAATSVQRSFLDCWYTAEIRNSSSQTILANDIALCSFNTLAVLLNVLANGSIVRVYLTSSLARQPVSNTLLFVLSVFHLLQGTLSQPLFIAMKVLESRKSFLCTLNAASKTMNGTFTGFSFVIVSYLLTSERLFAIVYPIRHRMFARKRYIAGVSAVIFFAWVTFIVSLQMLWKKFLAFQVVTLSVISGGLAYTVAVYIKIYCIVRKSSRAALAATKRASGSNGVDVLLVNKAKLCDSSRDNQKAFHIPATRSEWSERRLGMPTKGKEVPSAANKQELEFVPDIGNGESNKHLEMISADSYDADNSVIIDEDGNGAMTSTSKIPRDFADGKSQGVQKSTSLHCRDNCLKQVQGACLQSFSLSHREKKTILRMVCIVGALYLTHLPLLLDFIYVARHGVDVFLVKYFHPWALTLAYSSSIINSFIYCYRNEHFWIRN